MGLTECLTEFLGKLVVGGRPGRTRKSGGGGERGTSEVGEKRPAEEDTERR